MTHQSRQPGRFVRGLRRLLFSALPDSDPCCSCVVLRRLPPPPASQDPGPLLSNAGFTSSVVVSVGQRQLQLTFLAEGGYESQRRTAIPAGLLAAILCATLLAELGTLWRSNVCLPARGGQRFWRGSRRWWGGRGGVMSSCQLVTVL